MRIVTVQARIRDEALGPFIEASLTNARGSVGTEAGCRRFDLFQDAGDPNLVGFNEVYDDDAAAEAHGETEHFAAWLAATDGMADGEMLWATCRSLAPDPASRYPSLQPGDGSGSAGGLHVVQVRLRVFPDDLAAVIDALTVQAASSLTEPGCLRFDVSQSLDDPAELWLYEVYADAAAFQSHRAAAHSVTTRAKLENCHEPPNAVAGPNVWPPDGWDWAPE